jgi:hypothetical protein
MISEIDRLGRGVNTPGGRNSFEMSFRFIFSAGNSQRIPICFGFENCARFPAGVPAHLQWQNFVVRQGFHRWRLHARPQNFSARFQALEQPRRRMAFISNIRIRACIRA